MDARVEKAAQHLEEALADFGYRGAVDRTGGRIAIHNVPEPDIRVATASVEASGNCICQLQPLAVDDAGELVFDPNDEYARSLHGVDGDFECV